MPDNNLNGQQRITFVSDFGFRPHNYRIRARVCADCGHIDFYVHPDDLSDLHSDLKRKNK